MEGGVEVVGIGSLFQDLSNPGHLFSASHINRARHIRNLYLRWSDPITQTVRDKIFYCLALEIGVVFLHGVIILVQDCFVPVHLVYSPWGINDHRTPGWGIIVLTSSSSVGRYNIRDEAIVELTVTDMSHQNEIVTLDVEDIGILWGEV